MNTDLIPFVWFLHQGMILPDAYKPSAKNLAILAHHQASIDEVDEASAGCSGQRTVDNLMHRRWHDLANRLAQLSDQDAFALFIRAREYGSERR